MLIPSFFILDSLENAQCQPMPNTVLPDGCCLVYPVSLKDTARNSSLYNTLFGNQQEAPFCLLIECPAVRKDSDLSAIHELALATSFHFSYYTRKKGAPFLAFRGAVDDCKPLLTTFQEKFREQGFEDLDYLLFDHSYSYTPSVSSEKWKFAPAAISSIALQETYMEILTSTAADNVCLLVESSIERLSEDISAISAAENRLQQESPYTYQLLSRHREDREYTQRLLGEITVLKEKVASLNSYYSFYNQPESGYVKKIKEITDFYNNEYEVLPMWFKRLGHIVKVLMGKRTFGSLYRDDVKKYKQ